MSASDKQDVSVLQLGFLLRNQGQRGERTCWGVLRTPKPQLLPPQSTADKQLTGTKQENEGQAWEERGLARPRMEQKSTQ